MMSEDSEKKEMQLQDDKQKDSFVPLVRQPETDKTRQAMEAYGRTSKTHASRIVSQQGSQTVVSKGNIIKKESVMEKHDKPKKKSIIDRIGDALD